MWRILIALTLGLAIILAASAALAQNTTPSPKQATPSTQSPTPTRPSASTANSTQGAFGQLSPGGQKIALALCTAQSGGCPPPQASTPSPTAPTQSPTLTRDQIAGMKQHRGWGDIFKQMQQNGQIPADVKNLGQLVSGRYQAHSGPTSAVTITTASGKSQMVGTAGSHGSAGPANGDPAISNASGHSNPGGGQSSVNSHGGGHAK
jgi:hypothetical protein